MLKKYVFIKNDYVIKITNQYLFVFTNNNYINEITDN